MTQPPSDLDGARSTRARARFPVAHSAHQSGAALVHALDGDGTSFCGLLSDALRPIADIGWDDVAVTRRCRGCRIALIGIGADDR